jgi:hypothetical protein
MSMSPSPAPGPMPAAPDASRAPLGQRVALVVAAAAIALAGFFVGYAVHGSGAGAVTPAGNGPGGRLSGGQAGTGPFPGAPPSGQVPTGSASGGRGLGPVDG